MCLCDFMGVDTCVVVWMFGCLHACLKVCACVCVCVCWAPPHMHIPCGGGGGGVEVCVGGRSVGIIVCDVFV